jgi:hypothetical protein
MAPSTARHWADSQQAFWSLAVGVPTVILILRLWVEAGGSLQVTLVLAANVSPVSLITVVVTTVSWLFSTVVVAVLAMQAVFHRSSPDHMARHSFVDWVTTGPAWFKLSAFLLAALTWDAMYLPFLMLCAVAVFWPHPTGTGTVGPERWRRFLLMMVPVGAGTGALLLLWPTLHDAYVARLWFPLVVTVAPPAALVLGATGPVVAGLVPPLRVAAKIVLPVLLFLALRPVFATPILPLVVVVTTEPSGDLVPRRGHVISVDDTTTTVLLEAGGVDYIPNADVSGRILCPDEQDIPKYRLWIHGLHIEDSALQAIRRKHRPTAPIDPWCRAALHPEQRDSSTP